MIPLCGALKGVAPRHVANMGERMAKSTQKAMQRYQTTVRASQGQGALGSGGGAAGAANAARAGL